MAERGKDASAPDRLTHYEIRFAGHLGAEWSQWFDGMAIAQTANGDTLLTGAVADQAALHGLLRRVRDLGLTLLAINPVVDNPDSLSDVAGGN
jgi:hypothetical protein